MRVRLIRKSNLRIGPPTSAFLGQLASRHSIIKAKYYLIVRFLRLCSLFTNGNCSFPEGKFVVYHWHISGVFTVKESDARAVYRGPSWRSQGCTGRTVPQPTQNGLSCSSQCCPWIWCSIQHFTQVRSLCLLHTSCWGRTDEWADPLPMLSI